MYDIMHKSDFREVKMLDIAVFAAHKAYIDVYIDGNSSQTLSPRLYNVMAVMCVFTNRYNGEVRLYQKDSRLVYSIK